MKSVVLVDRLVKNVLKPFVRSLVAWSQTL